VPLTTKAVKKNTHLREEDSPWCKLVAPKEGGNREKETGHTRQGGPKSRGETKRVISTVKMAHNKGGKQSKGEKPP